MNFYKDINIHYTMEFTAMPESYDNRILCKVYSLLTVQLLITTVFSILCMEVDAIQLVVVNTIELLYASIIVMFATFILLFCIKDLYPYNMIFLHVFTCSVSYMVGVVCAIYAMHNKSYLIIYAFSVTVMSFIVLTGYVFYSKKDFSYLNGFLSIMLYAIIFHSVMALIVGFEIGMIYSILGVSIFSGYILMDTSFLLQKGTDDNYIIIVITLYLDIINFFFKFLELINTVSKCLKR